jgi:hypothetical protein
VQLFYKRYNYFKATVALVDALSAMSTVLPEIKIHQKKDASQSNFAMHLLSNWPSKYFRLSNYASATNAFNYAGSTDSTMDTSAISISFKRAFARNKRDFTVPIETFIIVEISASEYWSM